MSTSDPSQVDTATLFQSARRDLSEARARWSEAGRWLAEAHTTLLELERRQAAHPLKEPSDG